MGDFKPVFFVFFTLAVLSIFLNLIVIPLVGEVPSQTSALNGLIDFMNDGITFELPIIGEFTVNPIAIFWFGIDFVTDWINNCLIAISYLPDIISISLLVLILVSLLYSMLSMIRGN